MTTGITTSLTLLCAATFGMCTQLYHALVHTAQEKKIIAEIGRFVSSMGNEREKQKKNLPKIQHDLSKLKSEQRDNQHWINACANHEFIIESSSETSQRIKDELTQKVRAIKQEFTDYTNILSEYLRMAQEEKDLQVQELEKAISVYNLASDKEYATMLEGFKKDDYPTYKEIHEYINKRAQDKDRYLSLFQNAFKKIGSLDDPEVKALLERFNRYEVTRGEVGNYYNRLNTALKKAQKA